VGPDSRATLGRPLRHVSPSDSLQRAKRTGLHQCRTRLVLPTTQELEIKKPAAQTDSRMAAESGVLSQLSLVGRQTNLMQSPTVSHYSDRIGPLILTAKVVGCPS
jgi:hypothetical protein